ncbi:MAG: polymerase factor sigma-54 [Stenotrophomonas indicatrix]|jgi:RNA polymerase sigma-54 factor|uniref:RNA polymerase sigma-54 factor n=1 Tax=Stenotrophomonas indicatrix TaxID=2045451 RepID=A0A1W1GYI6_9GAMM|nr:MULTISPECIES: RNA polymerase factor sigma-54 [Stenotrophomonas]EVT71516.1 RNA polymerase sigma54 factor [Stenotrophomonas maltophilia 5BA-I-2]OJH77731.1 MAG: RNA polymerase factor sigma-54 [Stenotrophomonas maltophilia]MDF2480950.1 polymerase factor sigma-54 [Stenotrophomonas indicatrix]MDN8647308.1 RNA polymerase factor sigma-54 [Stenotrophomonas indicatrix]MDR6694102.1 RNA polymerase sigma-54 factor [Stenotrophomonas sp. 1337]
MKTRLQTSLGQQLVLTPQLQQAIKLLQMSTTELELEIAQAVESNPLLDWSDSSDEGAGVDKDGSSEDAGGDNDAPPDNAESSGDDWAPAELDWSSGGSGGSFDDDDDNGSAAERVAETETLADHLLWQLHLTHLSKRDRSIGAALIDSLEDDGYLREPLSAIAEALLPAIHAGEDEILTVLHQIQRFDPVGVAARSLGECLQLQLDVLPADTPCLALARQVAAGPLEQLPRSGVTGLAQQLKQPLAEVETAVALLRSLDPRPGTQIAPLAQDTYVVPDVVVWRQNGIWRAALAAHAGPKLVIHRGYEQMIRRCGDADAGYLRGQLQEARWLLKGLQARGETLLRVVRSLIQQQAGFLEFGEQALRPLTLREIAGELGLHESTVSRAIARKHVRTPRGTLPLRAFFASGIDTDGGGEASSTAIQAMIRRLIDDENPRKPLSDAKLADLLKSSGIPVARRTVAKYREAMNISASHERVRIV